MNLYDLYRKHLLAFPAQLKPLQGNLLRVETLRGAKPDGVVVVGMGGSGLPGIFLKALAGYLRLPVPVEAWKNHGLPKTSFQRPLFIFISFSGNTEETLSGLRVFLKRRAPRGSAAVIAGGGKLKALAAQHHLPCASFQATDLTPREGMGYLYYNLLSLLRVAFPSLNVNNLTRTIRSARGERIGKELAKHLAKKVVLIYSGGGFSHVGQAWKIILNETAKQLAFVNTYPEMGHNEIAALGDAARTVAAVFLRDTPESPHEKKHFEAIEALLRNGGISVSNVSPAGRTAEERTWNAFLLGHWTALAIAKQKKVNPQKTPLIERLKKEVNR
ncbi:MAG: SIS domain-containing protein [Candidatus Jorgensenbacteria bacterium]